jgi:type VI secretion system secreted protein Hcp
MLILSLMFSFVPLTGITLNLRSGSVNGWLEDIFGGPKTESANLIFVKFEGINGESTDVKHKDWIRAQSFEFSMVGPSVVSGTSRRSGDVAVNDIFITKSIDKATPKLMEALTSGKVIGEVIIEVTAATGDKSTFYRYELTNVHITSYQSGGESSGVTPGDVFSLNFEEIKVIYTQFDESGLPKGNIEWTWSVGEAFA